MSRYWFAQSFAAVYQLDSSALGERRNVTLVSLCLSHDRRQSLQRAENDGDSLTPPQKASHRGGQPRASPRGNATSENVKHSASPRMPAYHRPRSLPGRSGKAQIPPATRAPAGSGPHQRHHVERTAVVGQAEANPPFSPTSNHLHLSRTCGRRWTFGEISLLLWHR